MSKVRIDAAHEIGTTAGSIWQFLNENGPISISKLSKELDQSKDAIQQGIGWLAREGKVEFIPGKGKTKLLQLTE